MSKTVKGKVRDIKGRKTSQPKESAYRRDISACAGSNPAPCIYVSTSRKGASKVRFNALTADLRDLCYTLRDHQLAKLSKMINKIREERFKKGYRNKSEHINRSFSDEELRALFQALPDERYRVIFALQLTLSLRISEVVRLNIQQVDFLKQELVIYEPKTGAIIPKHVPTSLFERLLAYIDQHKEEIKGHKGFLWFSDGKNGSKCPEPHLSIAYLGKVFREARERAGLVKVYAMSKDGRKLFVHGTHSFRRTGISRMSEALGGNPFKLKQYSGHKSIGALERYVQPMQKEQLNNTIEEVFSPVPTSDRLKRYFG